MYPKKNGERKKDTKRADKDQIISNEYSEGILMKKLLLSILVVVVFIGTQFVLAGDVNESLKLHTLSYWSLDNDYVLGSSVIDLTGRQNGVYSGATTNQTGKINECFYFNASDDYINMNNLPFNGTSNFTFTFWLKPQNITTKQFLLGDMAGSTYSDRGFVVLTNNQGELRFAVQENGTSSWDCLATDNNPLPLGSWAFITFLRDGDIFKFYINSTLSLSANCTYNIIDSDLFVGAYPSDTADLKGNIDEVAIFDKALNTTEIAYLFASGSPTEQQQYDYNVSGEVTNAISIVSPTNKTYVYGTAVNVSISTLLDGACKYASNSSFNFATQGTLMNGVSTIHWFTVNATTELKNFSFYYKCNQSNGTITSSTLHFFKGQDKAWNNTFLGLGDSIVKATAVVGIDETNRFTQTVANYFKDVYEWYGFDDDNQGVGGACFSNYGSCSTESPTVDRYDTDLVNRNPRYAYIMPNINDNRYGVPISEYGDDAVTIYNGVMADATNSTIITSTVEGHTNYTGYTWSQQLSAGYNAKVREQAILHQIPFFEWHYIMNHNDSYMSDHLHLNLLGNHLMNDTLVAVIENPSAYTMSEYNFNIYHDCDNWVTVLNYSVQMPNSHCRARTDDDWLILKNLSNLNASYFKVERADHSFVLNITNLLYQNTNYTISLYNNSVWTNYTQVSNANGDLLGLSFGSGDDMDVYISPVCVPNYQCGGYAACNTSDLAPCNETIDSNNCSYGSLPSPSTFPAQSCNYCSADVVTASTGDCDPITDTQWVYQVDNNWDTCCNVTQIVADCPTGLNTSSTNTTQSCSVFDYSENDIGVATISTIAKFFISGYGFVILFVAVGIFSFSYPAIKRWLRK